jgi:hypothetical protein
VLNLKKIVRYIEKADWMTVVAPGALKYTPKVAHSLANRGIADPTALARFAESVVPALPPGPPLGFDVPVREMFLKPSGLPVYVFTYQRELYITDVNMIDGPLPPPWETKKATVERRG